MTPKLYDNSFTLQGVKMFKFFRKLYLNIINSAICRHSDRTVPSFEPGTGSP